MENSEQKRLSDDIFENFRQKTAQLLASKQKIADRREQLRGIFDDLAQAIDELKVRANSADNREQQTVREVELLRDQVDDLKAELKSMEEARDEYKKQQAEFEGKYRECERKLDSANVKGNELRTRLEEVEEALSENNQLIGRDKEQFQRDLNELKDDLVQQIRELESQQEDIRAERNLAQSKLKEAQDNFDELDEEFRDLETEKKKLERESDGLQKRLQQITEERDVAQAALEDARKDHDGVTEKMRELESENKRLDEQIREMDRRFTSMLQEIKDVKERTLDPSVDALSKETDGLDLVLAEATNLLRKFENNRSASRRLSLSRSSSSFEGVPVVDLPEGPTDQDIIDFMKNEVGSNQNRALSIPAIAFYVDPNASDTLVPPEIARGEREWNPVLQDQIRRVLEKMPTIGKVQAKGGRVGVRGWNMTESNQSVFRPGQELFFDKEGLSGRQGG